MNNAGPDRRISKLAFSPFCVGIIFLSAFVVLDVTAKGALFERDSGSSLLSTNASGSNLGLMAFPNQLILLAHPAILAGESSADPLVK